MKKRENSKVGKQGEKKGKIQKSASKKKVNR